MPPPASGVTGPTRSGLTSQRARDAMEPELVTHSRLRPVLDALRQLEPVFHRPEHGTTREDFERMIDADFWEVGASGQRYSRDYVIDLLVDRRLGPHRDVWDTRDFQCLEIAPDNYLLTYTLVQNGTRVTRRASLWRHAAAGWKIVYHQGTLVPDRES
jgi:hypothetical protein